MLHGIARFVLATRGTKSTNELMESFVPFYGYLFSLWQKAFGRRLKEASPDWLSG